MQDVLHLPWTSIDPEVLQVHEDELIQFYSQLLYEQLKERMRDRTQPKKSEILGS